MAMDEDSKQGGSYNTQWNYQGCPVDADMFIAIERKEENNWGSVQDNIFL